MRASSFGWVLTKALLLVAVVAAPATGCSEEPTLPEPTSVATTTSISAPSISRSEFRRLQHERIMAEQERRQGGTATEGTTTATASASGSPSVTSAPPASGWSEEGRTSVILTGGRTPLQGIWRGSAERLATYLLKVAPSPRFTVPVDVLAGYYVRYSAEAGLRADLLWAQMIHETGYGMYSGDVAPQQNNYAGIGATGGGAAGVFFTSAEAGVMAQVAHMVAYVYTSSPVPWASTMVDPRFDFVNPRGAASTLSDLDGRWAVPGIGYGERIEAIAREINSST